jgi:hypothetical protein
LNAPRPNTTGTPMTLLKIAGGTVSDPANNVNGVVQEV